MIKLTGDINFADSFFDIGFGVGSSISDGSDPFKYLYRESEDFWFGNCECVIADNSDKEGLFRRQFLISPISLQHIRHLDMYNVSNNHVMQHGGKAYQEMLNYFDTNKIKYVGSQNRKHFIISEFGKNIGITAFSQRDEKFSQNPLYWYNPEYTEIIKEFENIKHSDFKILYIHWGIEFINRPYADQKKFAHWLIDLGYDLIVGLHPHVLQGFEIYKGKHIFYSIGNFVFNMPSDATRYSAIVNLDFQNNDWIVTYDYINIGRDNFPRLIHKELVPHRFTFDYLNKCLDIEKENELYFKEVFLELKKYRKKNYIQIIRSLPNYKFKDLRGIIIDFINRRFLKK